MIGYPVAGKRKSAQLVEAFIEGARKAGAGDEPGAVFYGVDASNVAHWQQAAQQGVPRYYIDNSYFDCARGIQYRVTRNALQQRRVRLSNGARLAQLGVTVEAWQPGGAHVLVCPQSDDFMRLAGSDGGWTQRTIATLREHTAREIRVREWSSDKRQIATSLQRDLADCWALVTWSSAAAVAALLAGVPVFVGSYDCAAWLFAGWGLRHIERPRRPAGREEWARSLADHQWSVDEMRSGLAWEMLNA